MSALPLAYQDVVLIFVTAIGRIDGELQAGELRAQGLFARRR